MKQKLKSYNAQTYIAYALIAPAAIYIILIVAWPLLETIRLSFTNSSLAGEDYVGLENYQKMFSSKKFNGIVTRTFVWMFFSVSLKLLIGLIGAVLLNANLKGRSIFRVLVMPPWVVPIAIGTTHGGITSTLKIDLPFKLALSKTAPIKPIKSFKETEKNIQTNVLVTIPLNFLLENIF